MPDGHAASPLRALAGVDFIRRLGATSGEVSVDVRVLAATK